MTLDELRRVIAESANADWAVAAAAYLPGAGRSQLLVPANRQFAASTQYPIAAVHRRWPELTLHWGLPDQAEFGESWARAIGSQAPSSHWLEARWRSSPIERAVRVLIDDGRAGLPVPSWDDNSSGGVALVISNWSYRLFHLVERLDSGNDLSDYTAKLGFVVAP